MAKDDVPTIIKNLTYPSDPKAKKEQIKKDKQPVGPIMDSLTYSETEEKEKKDQLTPEEQSLVQEVEDESEGEDSK